MSAVESFSAMEAIRSPTGNHFLDSLSHEGISLLQPYFLDVKLDHGAVLCVPTLEIESVWFPTTAILSVVTVMADGQDVEACTIGHESAYGLLNALGSATAIDRVIAQVPGDAIRIPSARLRAAAALSLDITDLVVRHAQANAAQTQQSVGCNAIHSAEARLCRWLLMTQDRTYSVELPLTQEFLGFMLGVQRTTVNQAARVLQRAGLISYARGKIRILNRRGLKAGACECYEAVREKQAQILKPRPSQPNSTAA